MNKSGVIAVVLLMTLLPAVVATADGIPVMLKSRTFVPQASEVRFADLAQYAGRHIMVQFDRIPTADEREALESYGIHLLKAIPKNAYIAFVEDRDWSADKSISPMRWIGTLAAEDKVHPRILAGELDVHVVGPDGLAVFDVLCHPDVERDRCERALAGTGASVLSYTPALNLFQVRTDPRLVLDIASLDEVMWVAEPTPPFGPFNDMARAAIGADAAHGDPYYATGAGVKVLVYDGAHVLMSGGDAMHPDLQGRLVIGESLYMPDLIGHATHVSCTIAGTGAASGGKYAGMAPNVAQIISMAYTPNGMGAIPIFYNNPGDIEFRYKSAIEEFGAQVANNSIGSNVAQNGYNCDWEGDYEQSAALIDEIAAGKYGSIIIVWANGNERGVKRCGTSYGTVPPPCPAKNTIAVGAVMAEDASMTTFSSWGPTDDGRMRPDVVAPGDSKAGGIKSCFYFSTYMRMAGTSMASPVTTGAVALALELWNREVGPPDPPPHLMKALIVHGARDLGAPGPDYAFGYGLVQIPNTLNLILARAFIEFELDQGGLFTRRFRVHGTEPFKVTLAWTDPPGPLLSGKDLVNDPDLSVLTPTGDVALPFVLDPANPSVAAGRGINSIDPIEQVIIESPEEGIYEVRVSATAVPEGPQQAAVVFSGAEACAEEEICGNGIDDNCDGQIDEGCGEDGADDDTGGEAGGCGCAM